MLRHTKRAVALHRLCVKNYINIHIGVWPFLLSGVVGGGNSVTGRCTSHLESQRVAKKGIKSHNRALRTLILQKGAANTGRIKAFAHRQVTAKDWRV